MTIPKEQPTFSPIEALILLCSSQVNLPQLSEVDWAAVVDLAAKHRVTKTLGLALKKKELDLIESEAARIKAINKKSTLRMLSFTAEISLMCSAFQKKSIDVIPLKGPVVAQQIYNDFTAKNSRDIDLLVQEEMLASVTQWLSESGYKCLSPYLSFSPKQRAAFRKANNQLTFFHDKKKIQLEIHWRLFANAYLLPLSFDQLLKDSTPLSIGKNTVNCFSNTHLLFYLCAHGAKHHWALLYWLVELAALVQKENFEWESVLQEAFKLEVERPLIQGVMLLEVLFGIQAPENIRKQYHANKPIQHLVETSQQIILGDRENILHKSIANYWKVLSYKMKLKKSLRYKAAYWKLTSINDFELVKLPDALFFSYFWLRPVFWFWRYLIQPIKKE